MIRRKLIIILLAAVVSVSTVAFAWGEQRRTITASTAVRALQEAGISMGPPRQMVASEWDNVPLVAQEALAFSVGDLRGCFGCEDPMGYVLYLPDPADHQRAWEMVQAQIRRSSQPDWHFVYDELIVILPVGLREAKASEYRQVLDQLMASGPSLRLPRLDILSQRATG